MNRFKLGPLKFRHLICLFFFFGGGVNLDPSRKIVVQIRGLFSFGQGLPWVPGNLRPPPPLSQILATCLEVAEGVNCPSRKLI